MRRASSWLSIAIIIVSYPGITQIFAATRALQLARLELAQFLTNSNEGRAALDLLNAAPEYQKQETEMLPQVLAAYRQCEQGARDGRLADPPPELRQCLRGPNPLFSDKLNAAVRASKSRPEFWQTVITGSQAKATLFDDAVDPAEKHGKPVVVLTAVDAYADAPPAIRDALRPAQVATHKALVKTSAQGKRVLVKGASHDIQIDKPDTVVDAITDMVAAH